MRVATGGREKQEFEEGIVKQSHQQCGWTVKKIVSELPCISLQSQSNSDTSLRGRDRQSVEVR